MAHVDSEARSLSGFALIMSLSALAWNMFSCTADIDGASMSDIRSVESDVSSVKGDVSSVKGDVSSVERDVSSVERNVSSVKRDIRSVKSDVSSVKSDVSSVKRDVSSVKRDINGIEADVNVLSRKFKEYQSCTNKKLNNLADELSESSMLGKPIAPSMASNMARQLRFKC